MTYTPLKTILLREGCYPEEQWAYSDEVKVDGNATGLLGKVIDSTTIDSVTYLEVETAYRYDKTKFVTLNLQVIPPTELLGELND